MNDPRLWGRLRTALVLLAVDPGGLGGLWLRARPSPGRDRAVEALPGLPLPVRRVPVQIADTQLFGGVDIAATLRQGQVVREAGLLARPAALLLPMAERAPPGLAARLAQAMDAGTGHCLIALDEGADEDEALAPGLADRLAFRFDLGGLPLRDAPAFRIDSARAQAAQARLGAVEVPADAAARLVRTAAAFGIVSLRADLLALRVARAKAALEGRRLVEEADLALGAELVLAPRALVLPEEAAPPPPEPPPPEDDPDADGQDESGEDTLRIPQEMLIEAVRAALPADLLGRLAAARAVRATGGAGSGTARKGNRRGRPQPSRPGRLSGERRLDLIATLRAAAPWQRLRRTAQPGVPGLLLRPEDFRLKRYEERSDRLLIFVVDASGSAAVARLGEAKGAVELLLAEAYARRDHVALVAFRGTGADVLLPPTRSLVQTKRRLADLPGGGGTPLAAGLKAAHAVAEAARGRGMSPATVLLTDGRANIALDGRADRQAAADDAQALARLLRARGTPGLVIDMGARPERGLAALADTLAAPYIPLPRADARRLSSAVSAALEAGP